MTSGVQSWVEDGNIVPGIIIIVQGSRAALRCLVRRNHIRASCVLKVEWNRGMGRKGTRLPQV